MEIAKRIVGAALLLFVAVSVGVLVFEEVGRPTAQPPITDESEPASAQPSGEESAAGSGQTPEPVPAPEPYVIAYYFHNTRRCTTCLKIEAAAEAALRQSYVEELESGRLIWQTICMEEPEHAHFVYDFDLASPSLVAARIEEDRVAEWQLLDQTWALIRKPEQFDTYVIDAFASLLEDRQ